MLSIGEKFEGCILGGAIGDALGSGYENIKKEPVKDTLFLFGNNENVEPSFGITDDTQLTLATIETIVENDGIDPAEFANKFLRLYTNRKLTGVGASTLKALRELEFGGHWNLVGRTGEYAAGNGAAMRIAPLAFCENITRSEIRDVCSITHKNDEAYVGALSVVIAIQSIISGDWIGGNTLFEILLDKIPDTSVRDRLIEIRKLDNLREIGKLGNNGYVVNSVPLAIAAACRVKEIGIERMYDELIEIGGDTDTNCSIAGQIAGTLIGKKELPKQLLEKLTNLHEYSWIDKSIKALQNKRNW